jgi:hypothetical protein
MGTMNKWVKRKWIKALKSGKYPKGAGYLGDSRGYCCLGVLALEMVPEYANSVDPDRVQVDGSKHYLPDDLTLLYGLSRDEAGRLADINDSVETFEPVIRYIEANL